MRDSQLKLLPRKKLDINISESARLIVPSRMLTRFYQIHVLGIIQMEAKFSRREFVRLIYRSSAIKPRSRLLSFLENLFRTIRNNRNHDARNRIA